MKDCKLVCRQCNGSGRDGPCKQCGGKGVAKGGGACICKGTGKAICMVCDGKGTVKK